MVKSKQLKMLVEDREACRHVLNNIHDPLFIVDHRGKLLFVNPTCEKIFSPEKRHFSELFPEQAGGGSALLTRGKLVLWYKHKKQKIKYTVIPLWEEDTFLGAVGLARLKCIEDIYRLTLEFRKKKSSKNVEIKFKPKRLLPEPMQEIVGNNVYFVKTLHKAAAAAQTDLTVFIYGESGVGKQVVAEAIHKASNRASGPFIEVNCAAIPEALLESELFGYDSHSFTGALKSGKKGKFEAAENGTIFLDEIGEMPLSMQSKLLRVLQSQEIDKVGGTTVRVNARVMVATNKQIDKMVEEGSFREELYFRLNVIPIHIEPLRERKDDLDVLIVFFLDKLNHKYRLGKARLSTDVIFLFYNYNWPGNIRELENVLEYAYISARFEGFDEIFPIHLPDYFTDGVRRGAAIVDKQSDHKLKSLVNRLEVEYIKKTLRYCNYNKSAAIRLLQISRGNFYSKIKNLNLKV
jgi:transcriptional regulator with PAS, ATPase and Fis domain